MIPGFSNTKGFSSKTDSCQVAFMSKVPKVQKVISAHPLLQVVATHRTLQGGDSRSNAAKPHVCPHATAAKVKLVGFICFVLCMFLFVFFSSAMVCLKSMLVEHLLRVLLTCSGRRWRSRSCRQGKSFPVADDQCRPGTTDGSRSGPKYHKVPQSTTKYQGVSKRQNR